MATTSSHSALVAAACLIIGNILLNRADARRGGIKLLHGLEQGHCNNTPDWVVCELLAGSHVAPRTEYGIVAHFTGPAWRVQATPKHYLSCRRTSSTQSLSQILPAFLCQRQTDKGRKRVRDDHRITAVRSVKLLALVHRVFQPQVLSQPNHVGQTTSNTCSKVKNCTQTVHKLA